MSITKTEEFKEKAQAHLNREFPIDFTDSQKRKTDVYSGAMICESVLTAQHDKETIGFTLWKDQNFFKVNGGYLWLYQSIGEVPKSATELLQLFRNRK